MTFTITRKGVLFALAIYAAVLSTWNLIKAIRKDRRAVRVTVNNKFPVFTNGQLGGAWAHIEATNVGQRPVTISMISLEVEGGRRLFNVQNASYPGMDNTALPITLADGQTARVHFSCVEIAHALASKSVRGKSKVTPICEDTAGSIHRGKAWHVDPLELVRM